MQVHPYQISPAEAFDIFYFIRNHTDADTYFIRAKVYDVRTGELLDTLTLDQSSTNARLFLKTAIAPPDPTSYGRNIVAIATVYTDSAYTTKSENYEEQEQYYLIKAASPVGGGGGFFDWGALEERFSDMLDKKLAALPRPKALPDMPFEALFGALGALQREVNRIPKDLLDIADLSASLGEIRASIAALPKPEKVNLSGLGSQLAGLLQEVKDARKETGRNISTLASEATRRDATLADKLMESVEAQLKELMDKQELTIPLSSLIRETPKETVKPDPIKDIEHLFS
ncbi:MAG: hypothetical protein ACK4UO_12990 [Pseudolabrys sp.]